MSRRDLEICKIKRIRVKRYRKKLKILLWLAKTEEMKTQLRATTCLKIALMRLPRMKCLVENPTSLRLALMRPLRMKF